MSLLSETDPRLRRALREFRPAIAALEGRVVLSGSGASRGVVLAWNAAALDAIRADKTAPPMAARDLAIVQVAVDDAVAAITHDHRPIDTRAHAPQGASIDAAVASAADRALSALFPAQAGRFDAALASSLAAVSQGQGKAAGIALGRRVADSTLAWRRDDGSAAVVAYSPGSAPGEWRPTAPAFAPALLPQWPGVRPFALRSAGQFRPASLPSLDGAAYASAVNEVEALGSVNSTARTAEQTEIARFWADGAGTATPPGHWNEIAAGLIAARRLGPARAAHVLAVLDVALADAGIAAWDAKYAEDCWRPIDAIRHADEDGNPRTTADPSWAPLLATPPFPSYVSGHSTFSAAAATVLSSAFGPRTRFSTISDALPGVSRSFEGFGAAAREAGRSRIYGGIHFAFDDADGRRLGHEVGRIAAGRLLRRA